MAVAFCAGVSQVTLSTPGGPFPLVLRHSSHGERFRTERVGEQVLEGTHLPPPALLYCLHDTGLKPTHGLVDPPPINRMPVPRVVGGRTSNHLRLRGCFCRHLLCLLSRLVRYSRDERPDGSQPAFAWGPVPRRAQPLSHLLPMGIRLLRPPLPAALSARLAARFPWREHDGLTKFRLRNRMGEALPIHRWCSMPMSRDTSPRKPTTVRRYQHLGLRSGSRCLSRVRLC